MSDTVQIDDPRIAEFLHLWHENGRTRFENTYESLDYDSPSYSKTAKDRRKYIALDDGTSGRFLLDKGTGIVWGIKAYGVPHRGKCCGRLDTLITKYQAANLSRKVMPRGGVS